MAHLRGINSSCHPASLGMATGAETVFNGEVYPPIISWESFSHQLHGTDCEFFRCHHKEYIPAAILAGIYKEWFIIQTLVYSNHYKFMLCYVHFVESSSDLWEYDTQCSLLRYLRITWNSFKLGIFVDGSCDWWWYIFVFVFSPFFECLTYPNRMWRHFVIDLSFI